MFAKKKAFFEDAMVITAAKMMLAGDTMVQAQVRRKQSTDLDPG